MDGANDVVFESGERYIVLWNGLDDIRRIDSDLYGRRRDGDVFVFCGMKRHDRQGRERVGTGGEGDELDVVLDRRMHARVVGFFGNFVAHEPHRFEIGFEFVELVGDGGDAIRRRICRDGETKAIRTIVGYYCKTIEINIKPEYAADQSHVKQFYNY